MRKEGMRGVTLTELMTVIAVSGILMSIAGLSLSSLRARYDAEAQVRQMHTDMMNARVRAMHRNKACFVTVTAGDYQISEDTNESGGSAPDAGDLAWWSAPKKFKYPSQWAGTVIMEAKGTIAKSGGGLLTNNALAIQFNAAGVDPEYDCILIGPTRINAGKWNGHKCAPR